MSRCRCFAQQLCGGCAVFFVLTTGAQTAAAQIAGPAWQASLQSLADRLAAAITRGGVVKIGVLRLRPIGNDIDEATVVQISDQIVDSMLGALRRHGSPAQLLERPELERVMSELRLSATGAVEPSAAAQLGLLVTADQIVTGTLTRSNASRDLVATVRLIQTETGQIIESATTTWSLPNLTGDTAAGQISSPRTPGQQGWFRSKKLFLVGGYSVAAGAGAMFWAKESDLRNRVNQIRAASAVDDFNQRLDAARRVAKTRDRWAAVAASAGGVTLGYTLINILILRDAGPAGVPGSRGPIGKRRWVVQLEPARPRLLLTWQF